jgi:hypothetical protein
MIKGGHVFKMRVIEPMVKLLKKAIMGLCSLIGNDFKGWE